MNRLPSTLLIALVSFSFIGCGGGGTDPKPVVKDKATKDASHKDHVHKDHVHKDHVHKGHAHEGEHFKLGTQKAGAYEITATQVGLIKDGEGVLELEVKGLEKGAGKVRAWAGTADAKGAFKTPADATGDHIDMHIDTGEKLPADAKWWVEVEPTTGEKATASFDIKR